MPFYISNINGCVYTLDNEDKAVMLYTPLSDRNTFNGNVETWIEVDFMLDMDSEAVNRIETEYAYKLLQSYDK